MRAMQLPRIPAPKMVRVSQAFDTTCIPDVRGETYRKLIGAGLRKEVHPGHRIAITAGSRDMGGFLELLRGITDAIRSCGAEPVIIPTMGSHGGATAEGQTEVLRRLGVTEDSIGAPIVATMDAVELGTSESGAKVFLDNAAAACDGVIVLGWTKAHPEGKEGIASGLLKMTAVGLGKQRGAQQAHSNVLWDSIRAMPKLTLATGKILFGVAVVENAYRNPVAIEVVPATYETFLEADERLLKLSHNYFATLPFEHLDLLIIDRFGKNISGTGMSPHVVGPWRYSGGKERSPNYHRIVPLSLTPESVGNGIGIGIADFTTQRFLGEYDPYVTYINVVTASEPGGTNTREGPTPIGLPSDREAIEVALASALPGDKARICRIESTAHLEEFWASEALLDEVQGAPGLTALTEPQELQYNAKGDLF